MSKRSIASIACVLLVLLAGCTTATTQNLPRVVGAISTGNKQVRVSFSKRMNDDAADPGNYSIVQQNPTGNDSQLLITGAEFVDDAHTVVELTTLSQNEVRYQLTAVSMRDRSGNALAPKQAVGGVLMDPTSAVFQGTPPGLADMTDSDDDSLSDNAEQRGWDVFVVLGDGHGAIRHATSDPNSADTDEDGIPDRDEKAYGTDPRSADTDGDSLTDYQELNEIYSAPLKQDSDGDGLADGLEFNFFRTSPILADTDGDQFTDAQELLQLDRDPLIADLPRLQILVGEARLTLNVASSYTDEQGETKTTDETLQTTFGETKERSFGTSDTASNQTTLQYGLELGGEVSSTGAKASVKHSFGLTFANGFTSAVDRKSAETCSREYQNSVSRAFSQSQKRAVTRNVEGAEIVTDVSIQNLSDIAFTIKNLELSVLQKDRRNANRFIPVAALRLQGAADPAKQPAFNLGPFDPERGPFIFKNASVFPNLVEELMREPQGLVYRVVNFDLQDEFGRNFVFSSQELNDRTVGITIDFGGGEVEAYRVATHNRFDANGQMQPITMQRALEIIGITPSTDPSGDTPDADPNDLEVLGTYGTQRDGDDGVEVLTRIRGVQTDLALQDPEKRFWAVISANRRVPATEDFGSIELRAGDSFLFVFTRDLDQDGLLEREEIFYGSSDESDDTDGDCISDLYEVRTGWSVAVKGAGVEKVFSSPASADTDGDGLTDDVEMLFGTDLTRKDTDSEGLCDDLVDDVEMLFGTDPTREDTDFDGLSDKIEIDGPIEILLFDRNTTDETSIPEAIVNGSNGTCDTEATGDDVQEVALGEAAFDGQVVVSAGKNGKIDTKPNRAPTGKGSPEGSEGEELKGVPGGDDYLRLARDQVLSVPRYKEPEAIVNGFNGICETIAIGDDVQEVAFGAAALDGQVVVSAGKNGKIDTKPNSAPTSEGSEEQERESVPDDYLRVAHDQEYLMDPLNPDTDYDGVPDGREVILGINPNRADSSSILDTDNDGLSDEEEDAGWDISVNDGIPTRVTSDKFRADTDRDGIPDVYERAIGTNPRSRDTDEDGLFDSLEFDRDREFEAETALGLYDQFALADARDRCQDALACAYERPDEPIGTDPRQRDTDGDGLWDKEELNSEPPSVPTDSTDPPEPWKRLVDPTQEFGGPKGTWDKDFTMCPAGTWVMGGALKIKPLSMDVDETALNGIRLECGTLNSPSDIPPIEPLNTAKQGTWEEMGKCHEGYVIGARLRIDSRTCTTCNLGAVDAEFRCSDYSMKLRGDTHINLGDWTKWQECPPGSAICGLNTKVEPSYSSRDDTGLNDVKFCCCTLP